MFNDTNTAGDYPKETSQKNTNENQQKKRKKQIHERNTNKETKRSKTDGNKK